jgi:hypothetical protein
MKPLLTSFDTIAIETFCLLTGVSETSVPDMVLSGELRGFKINGAYLVRQEDNTSSASNVLTRIQSLSQ